MIYQVRRNVLKWKGIDSFFIDPLVQPIVTASSDYYFRTCCLYVRQYVCPHIFQNLARQNNSQVKIVIATGGDCWFGQVDHWWHTHVFYWSTRPTTVQAGSDHYFHKECPSVRPSQNFKIKRQSLPAGTVGWPSGSLMTHTCLLCIISCRLCFCWHGHYYFKLHISSTWNQLCVGIRNIARNWSLYTAML